MSQQTGRASSTTDRTLFDLLRSCQMGEAGAIVGGHIDRNELRQNLYVPTEEDETLTEFFVDGYREDGKLLIITGSAGDGKSALLSRAFKQAKGAGQPIEEAHIRMDATASDGKYETYDVALERFLQQVSADRTSEQGPRTGLAINLGLAIDFFDRKEYATHFPDIWNAIDAVRSQREYVDNENGIHVLNLGHRELYSTRPDELGTGLLHKIVEKFAFDQPASPFHEAFKREQRDCPNSEQCPLHYNATQFTNPEVRERITKILTASSIINTAYLNPRSILDHVSSMILPQSMQRVDGGSSCPVGATVKSGTFGPDVLLWNTVFERLSGPTAEDSGYIDPAAQSSVSLDQELLSWGADPDRLDELIGNAPLLSTAESATQIRTILRRLYLLDKPIARGSIETAVESPEFQEFVGGLTYLNQDLEEASSDKELQQHIKALLRTVTKSLQGWSGSINDSNYIEFVDGIKTTDYSFLSKWSRPDPDQEESHRQTKEETTPGQLWLVLQPDEATVTVPVPVTFELYQLMNQIRNGYNPNAIDLERSEGMRLIQSRLSEFTNKQELVRVVDKLGEELFRVEKGGFDSIEITAGDRQ